MIEQFNVWFFGNGGYEFIGGFVELIALIGITVVVGAFISSWLSWLP